MESFTDNDGELKCINSDGKRFGSKKITGIVSSHSDSVPFLSDCGHQGAGEASFLAGLADEAHLLTAFPCVTPACFLRVHTVLLW